MTKLNWRLKDLPTADEIASLVEQEVITKEEAREMLFKDKDELKVDEKVKSLKEQIEFLEGVVDRLTKNRSSWTWTYTPSYPTIYWNTAKPLYQTLGMSTLTTSSSLNGAISVNNSSLLGSTVGKLR